MKTIEELAEEYIEKQREDDEYLNVPDVEVMSVEQCEDFWRYTFKEIAEIQRTADIENCIKWCENFNKEAEKTGCIERIDVESFRQWITNMIINYDERRI